MQFDSATYDLMQLPNLHILNKETVCDILYDLHMMLVPYLTWTKHVLPAEYQALQIAFLGQVHYNLPQLQFQIHLYNFNLK